MLQTPVLLITFNRPSHTKKVFEAIKKQKPAYFFVFQDGARTNNESDVEKCQAVRTLFQDSIDWDCEFKTFYSDKNLGCGPGPAAGISWFFDHVEAGIIIEDDAVPAADFFYYAEVLLEKYKDNSYVRAIGSMKVDNSVYGDGSYYFSMMNRTLCAWATWRRAWHDFDYYLRNVSKKEFYKAMSFYKVSLLEKEYWYERLLEIQQDGYGHSSWDQQFWMSIWLHRGKGISPNYNLSSNIGFGEDATHTFYKDSIAAKVDNERIVHLVHPTNFSINRKADLQFHKSYFQPLEYGLSGIKRLPYRINRRLKRFLSHEGPWIK